ncbi:hypothetical protein B0O80DRAFT_383907, partial [Mortierella sp. GBAus27b]
QNRAAQRAFRERKEKYVKSLEDRIKELEEQQQPAKSDAKLAEENMNLKVLVQRLETENYSLKERSFTFDFPISQPGLYRFDDPVETTFPEDPINDLFSDQLLDYSFTNVATLPVPAPVPAQVQPQAPVLVKKEDKEDSDDECGKTKHRLPPLGENEKAIPCPQAWQQISAHPKFDDADMDLLCAEMKSKAKCSGHGPVIPLSEVDKLISKLDQE